MDFSSEVEIPDNGSKNREVTQSVDISPNERNTIALFGGKKRVSLSPVASKYASENSSALPEKTMLDKNFYITSEWSPQIYFTSRGAENFHVYLWITKDFCWTQQYRSAGIVFGSMAMAWCGVLIFHALIEYNFEDAYMLVALTLWLGGNFFWMLGELQTNDDAVGGYDGIVMFEVSC